MKLKGPGKQTFNVLFHTHTVSGIVISFALFVIFYAGAWALFRYDLATWENPYLRQKINPDFSYEKAITLVDSIYDLDWYRGVSLELPKKSMPYFRMVSQVSETDSTSRTLRAYVETFSYEISEDVKLKTTASETIYHLHYFDQIPVPRLGRTLSSAVALFFLFAIVTGVIIHWKNLLTKFYAFVTEGKWKMIWTNMHTVFGVIGLPFQVMYAVTGAFFGLLFAIAPSLLLVHDGDTGLINKVRFPEQQLQLNPEAAYSDNLTFTESLMRLKEEYPDIEMQYATIKNYQKEDAIITFRAQEDKNLGTRGRITMRMKDGRVLKEYSVDPTNKPYHNHVQDWIRRLHYAEFGGFLIRLLFFLLAMFTCLMIIAGVLIWRYARDNKRYTYEQRLFHHRVTKIYLAICFSMFPAVAIIYLAEKLVPLVLENRVAIINQTFFFAWLFLTVVGCFWNSYTRQNKNYLILGSTLVLCLPLANGLSTGLWPWVAWSNFPEIAIVDISWLFMGVITLFVAIKLLKVKATDKPSKDDRFQVRSNGKAMLQAPGISI
ncbi:MAG: PepSY-associated TM helix domain-containing protein [Bacteroidota bacterium]